MNGPVYILTAHPNPPLGFTGFCVFCIHKLSSMVVSTGASQQGFQSPVWLGPLCGEFACSPHICVVSLRVLRPSQIIHGWMDGWMDID